MLLLVCEGVIPRFDVALLLADTGWEPRAVYENLARLRAHAAKFGIPVRTVSAGNIRDDALRCRRLGCGVPAEPSPFRAAVARNVHGAARTERLPVGSANTAVPRPPDGASSPGLPRFAHHLRAERSDAPGTRESTRSVRERGCGP